MAIENWELKRVVAFKNYFHSRRVCGEIEREREKNKMFADLVAMVHMVSFSACVCMLGCWEEKQMIFVFKTERNFMWAFFKLNRKIKSDKKL